jgi:ISXO2-like transposase domain
LAGFALHGFVNHGIGEYVRGDIHTNTIEGYISIFKRGITGVYHHVSQEHLKRYLAEFDFRYNERMALDVDDMKRTTKAIKGIVGKRLTYRRTDKQPNQQVHAQAKILDACNPHYSMGTAIQRHCGARLTKYTSIRLPQ